MSYQKLLQKDRGIHTLAFFHAFEKEFATTAPRLDAHLKLGGQEVGAFSIDERVRTEDGEVAALLQQCTLELNEGILHYAAKFGTFHVQRVVNHLAPNVSCYDLKEKGELQLNHYFFGLSNDTLKTDFLQYRPQQGIPINLYFKPAKQIPIFTIVK